MAARSLTLCTLALAAASAACSGGGSDGSSGRCSLPAADALTVVEASPAAGATGVSVNAAVTLRFNTCVDTGTLAAAVLFSRGTAAVPHAASYDAATATLTLTPSAPLAFSTSYLVAILPTLEGARGEAHAGWGGGFRTRATPETVPPSTTPSLSGGRFDHAVEVALACADDPGGTGCAATHYTIDGTEPGEHSPRYAAPVAIAVTTTLRFRSVDVEGNWEAPRSETYVIDTDPPGVLSVFPADGATEVPVDVVASVAFDEDMALDGLAGGRVRVTPVAWPSASADAAGRLASIHFSRPLDCATTYAVTFVPDPTDVAGNPLAAPLAWSFTTTGDCAAPVTTPSLEDGVYAGPRSVTLSCDDGDGAGCARLVYTTDGSVPTLSHGTSVEGATAGPLALPEGETVLRFFAVDRAGHREPVREERYAVSSSGFTYVVTGGGVARGAGAVPERFTTLPSFGWTYAFHRDRTTGRLWRATQRGVAFSDDDVSWTAGAALKDDYGMTLQGYAVWAEGSLVFAGTRDGLFASYDGGMSFVRVLRQTSGYDVAQITDLDGAGKDVFVATTLGLAVSHDRGRTFWWHGQGTAYADVDFDPDTGEVWAASATGLHRSEDRGATFTRLGVGTSPALPSDAVRSVAATATHVHVATAAGYVRLARGASGAPDSARTLSRPCPAGDTSALEVAVSGAKVFVVTGEPYYSGSTDAFCVSEDGGETFTARWFSAPDRKNAIASTVFAEGATVLVGYSPSFFRSTDGGATFDLGDLPEGSDDVVATGGRLFLATGDGIAVSSDGFRTFTMLDERDGLRDRDVTDLAAGAGTLFAASSWGLSVSGDGGATFSAYPATTFVNPPDCVAAEGDVVWVGGDTALYGSVNGGASFARRLPPAGQTGSLGGTRSVAVRGQTMALASRESAWISTDGGATFAERGAADGLVPYWSYLSLEAAAVTPGGDVWLGSSGGAFVSSDGGVTFTRAAAVPSDVSVKAISVEPGAPLYVGTLDGLGISEDGGATFTWRGTAEGLQGAGAAVFVP